MLSEPEGQVESSAPTVVFLNVGRIAHPGPARLWVELARSWAAGGLRCLRVDLSGLGDSPTRPGRTELVEFPADALDDLDDIRAAAAAQEGADLIFVGLCSGADHAIEAALHGPIASICVVNPALSNVRWGWHRYRRFEPNLEGSSGSSDGQSWGSTRPWLTRAMARLGRLRSETHRIPNFGWWIVNRWFMTASPVRTLERLAQSDVDVLIVAGTDEAVRLCRGEHHRFRALVRKGYLRMEVLTDLDHSLLKRSSRDRVSALLTAYVTHRAAGAARTDSPGRGAGVGDPYRGPAGAAARS
jgi:alpha-beta hydrolase superfamily lysophospholipase